MGVDRVGERGEDVLVVGGHAGAPLDLLRPPQSFVAAQGVVGVVAGVTVAQRVGLVVFDEAFLAVFADGLQQPVPGVETTTCPRPPTTGPPARSATRTRHGASIGSHRHRPPRPPRGCNHRRTPTAGPRAAAATRRAGRRTSRSWPATSVDVSPRRRRPPASTSNRRSNADANSAGLIEVTRRRGQLDRQRHAVETTTHLTHRRGVRSTRARNPRRPRGRAPRTAAPHPTPRPPPSPRPRREPPTTGTANIRSPSRARPSRLVASTTTRGQVRVISSTRSATASNTCSQLSTTNNNCFVWRNSPATPPTSGPPARSPRTPPRTRRPHRRDHAPPPARSARHPRGTGATPPPRPATPDGSCRHHPLRSASRPEPRPTRRRCGRSHAPGR